MELEQRVLQTWAKDFGLEPEQFTAPCTVLLPDSKRTEKNWLLLWPVGEGVVVQLAQEQVAAVQEILAQYPQAHRLTGAELQAAWDNVRVNQDKFYALDETTFQRFAAPEPYTMRVLTEDDQAAFDAFQEQCSPEDRDQGQIAIQDELAVGVLHGERIVAGASMFCWHGFSDIGVLTDPAYRRQGLGKIVVSGLCEAMLQQPDHDRVIFYRHEADNRGSQRIAVRLNLHFLAIMEAVSPPE